MNQNLMVYLEMNDQSDISREFIETLVAFDTTSYNSNLELIHFIKDYLSDYDTESVLVFSEDKTKANLYATIGPQDKSGVMLSGHTDVVPVKGQNWRSDPFSVIEKNDALYGRGTADMKSFIAIVLAYIPQLANAELTTPVHLAFSYDEEIGCVGVRRLLDMMHDMPIKPAMCIVGEPTSMHVVNAHKGKLAQRIRIFGLEAHSSLPNIGVNAIEYAAELIVFIRKIANRLKENGPYEEGFEVTYTTMQTGKINGGVALNIVPNYCELQLEIRNIPKHDPQPLLDEIIDFAKNQLEPEMKSVDSNCRIEFEHLSAYPGMFTAANEEVIEFVQTLTTVDELKKVTYGTEGGLFSEQLGIPTVVCGPGNIEQAHKPDEFIRLDQIHQMQRFMTRLIKALS